MSRSRQPVAPRNSRAVTSLPRRLRSGTDPVNSRTPSAMRPVARTRLATEAISDGVCWPSASAQTTSAPGQSLRARSSPVRSASPLPALAGWETTSAPRSRADQKEAA